MEPQTRSCSNLRMGIYSIGEIANTLVEGSLGGFAMLYYTDALGLKPSAVGVAISLAIFWYSFTIPVMGHISDNTRSRFGRRHPYILFGGLAMVASFILIWFVPNGFKSNVESLFFYLLVVNVILKTSVTMFGVPFTALGFELCADYEGRVKLQSFRGIMGTVANLCGPALAWTIFFSNNETTRATSVQSNYLRMGASFAIVAFISILVVVIATRRHIKDSRNIIIEGNNISGFFRNMKEIISDFYPRYVFACIFVMGLGITLVSSLQMYLYEHFMKLSGFEKTIAHGGTMVGCGIGTILASSLARKFDKKGAVCFGVILSVCCNLILAALFLPGILKPGQLLAVGGINIPFTYIIFVIFHSLYWLGNGIMFPITASMMADVSEINEIKTGINKDGAYSSVFSFAGTCAASVGTFICGYSLTLVGFEAGKAVQSPEVVWKLCALTFIVGPIISLLSLGLIRYYPVTKELLSKLRSDKIQNAD